MKSHTPSLKTILMFSFSLVGGLPIVVTGFIAGRIISNDVATDVRAKNLLIAQSLTAEVELFLDQSFSFLKQIEKIIIDQRYVRDTEINSYLQDSLETNRAFDSIEILDEEGVVRFMAPLSPDVIGINRSGHSFYSHVSQQHRPYWSPTFISLETERPTITLAIPVKGAIIVGYINLASLNAVTDKIHPGEQGYALIVDQEGTVIVHPDRRLISERQNLRRILFNGHGSASFEGNFTYRENDREYLASSSRVPQTQWMVIVTVPADAAFEPVTRIRTLFGVGAALAAVLALAIAFVSLQKAAKPLAHLVLDTRSIAEGNYAIREAPSGYKEINDLIDHFYRMARIIQNREESLRESLEDKTALLKELHHRVKNNLQIVVSLLSLQTRRVEDQNLKTSLQDTRDRIHSMALLHEMLYRSDNLAQINFVAYVEELCRQLKRSFGSSAARVCVESSFVWIGLPLEQSVPCGLIINELVTNAFKHAFRNKPVGVVTVKLQSSDRRALILSIKDNGVGLPSGFDPASSNTLGIQLVCSLASQLKGQLTVERSDGEGAVLSVTFPVSDDVFREVAS